MLSYCSYGVSFKPTIIPRQRHSYNARQKGSGGLVMSGGVGRGMQASEAIHSRKRDCGGSPDKLFVLISGRFYMMLSAPLLVYTFYVQHFRDTHMRTVPNDCYVYA